MGDIHPSGKWVWTEYAAGKFDWRTDPNKRQRVGRKPGKASPQVDTKVGANKANSNKKSVKTESDNKLTLDEILAKPAPKGLSTAQSRIFKLFKKGYRLMKGNGVLWMAKDGEREAVNKDVLYALQKRLKIDYEPAGIWMNG